MFDKFYVFERASAALDDGRRQEFVRADAVMREHGCEKRWLLLQRWKIVRSFVRSTAVVPIDGTRSASRLPRLYAIRSGHTVELIADHI